MTLESLAEKIGKCKKCRLHQSRKRAVPGKGNKKAEVIFVGEAPGKKEDERGVPFIGKAGEFFNEILQINNMEREKVFITNCVKCRPPGNRTPYSDELDICYENYLKKQIDLIKPKLIVALGQVAFRKLSGKNLKLKNAHGKIFMHRKIKLFCTYHPAAGMRFPKIRKKMHSDFKKIKVLFIFFMFALIACPAQAGSVKNINVPFTVQAPDGWYAPFDQACEEAAIVMLDNFYQGKTNIADPKREILDIVKIENEIWGYNKDANAHQMTHLINNYFAFEADIKKNPSLIAIKKEIDNNRPVLVPVFGHGLENPNFRGAGPIYHVVIIKGYDNANEKFITNEPGTVHGQNWKYGYAEMMRAIHDLNYENQQSGEQLAIFTHGEIYHSGWSDADQDGYSKSEEIKYNTSLKNKNSHPKAKKNIYEGKALRSYSDERVFLIKNNRKYHIKSAQELFFLGFGWSDIIWVDQEILNQF